MLTMILKMSGITLLYVLLTVVIWIWISRRQMGAWHRLLIGLIYGGCSVLSTHFGVDFSRMMLNVRDLGPLMSGLFFDPASGIIAGLIGGIERYIAGTYWDVGSYTRIACSVSTCLAGFLAASLRVWLFKHKKPSAVFGFILGAVMEVFHMYVVLITHREDMTMAIYVVSICAVPMILFTGIGMAGGSAALQVLTGEWRNPFRSVSREEKPVSHRFQFWLFIVTTLLLIANLVFSYALQTSAAVQNARNTLTQRTVLPGCTAEVTVNADCLRPGDVAGLCLLIGSYGLIGMERNAGGYALVMKARKPGEKEEQEYARIPWERKETRLRASVRFAGLKGFVQFAYLDGQEWKPLGPEHTMTFLLDHFTGCRFGLFLYAAAGYSLYLLVKQKAR